MLPTTIRRLHNFHCSSIRKCSSKVPLSALRDTLNHSHICMPLPFLADPKRLNLWKSQQPAQPKELPSWVYRARDQMAMVHLEADWEDVDTAVLHGFNKIARSLQEEDYDFLEDLHPVSKVIFEHSYDQLEALNISWKYKYNGALKAKRIGTHHFFEVPHSTFTRAGIWDCKVFWLNQGPHLHPPQLKDIPSIISVFSRMKLSLLCYYEISCHDHISFHFKDLPQRVLHSAQDQTHVVKILLNFPPFIQNRPTPPVAQVVDIDFLVLDTLPAFEIFGGLVLTHDEADDAHLWSVFHLGYGPEKPFMRPVTPHKADQST